MDTRKFIPLIYVTGPVRSGKSRAAVELAKAWGPNIVFVATFRFSSDDEEMVARVTRHRAERPGWQTLEAPREIAKTLKEISAPISGVIIDCLTLWVSDRLDLSDEVIVALWERELAALRALRVPVVIVSNEVGWSLVPESPVSRRFRDLVGTLGQKTATLADEAWLLVAGCKVLLKKTSL